MYTNTDVCNLKFFKMEDGPRLEERDLPRETGCVRSHVRDKSDDWTEEKQAVREGSGAEHMGC